MIKTRPPKAPEKPQPNRLEELKKRDPLLYLRVDKSRSEGGNLYLRVSRTGMTPENANRIRTSPEVTGALGSVRKKLRELSARQLKIWQAGQDVMINAKASYLAHCRQLAQDAIQGNAVQPIGDFSEWRTRCDRLKANILAELDPGSAEFHKLTRPILAAGAEACARLAQEDLASYRKLSGDDGVPDSVLAFLERRDQLLTQLRNESPGRISHIEGFAGLITLN
jgi:hypothetical protein